MSKGINLLGAEQRISAKIGSQKLKILRATAVWSLFGISGASIVLFLLIALSPLPSLQKQEQDVRAALAQHHPDVAKLLLVNDRLKGSEEILARRGSFNQTLDAIQAKMPEDTEITGLVMNDKEISVTISSASLASLNTFMDRIVAATEAKEDFSKVTLIDFFTNQNVNSYIVKIEVVSL